MLGEKKRIPDIYVLTVEGFMTLLGVQHHLNFHRE